MTAKNFHHSAFLWQNNQAVDKQLSSVSESSSQTVQITKLESFQTRKFKLWIKFCS